LLADPQIRADDLISGGGLRPSRRFWKSIQFL